MFFFIKLRTSFRKNRNFRFWNLGGINKPKSISRIHIDNRVHIVATNNLETTDIVGILAQKVTSSLTLHMPPQKCGILPFDERDLLPSEFNWVTGRFSSILSQRSYLLTMPFLMRILRMEGELTEVPSSISVFRQYCHASLPPPKRKASAVHVFFRPPLGEPPERLLSQDMSEAKASYPGGLILLLPMLWHCEPPFCVHFSIQCHG